METLVTMVEPLIALDLSFVDEQIFHIMSTYIFFWLGYFNFWIDSTCVVLSFVPLYAMRVHLHGDSVGLAITSAVLMVPWHVLNLFFIHWVYSKCGFLYIEAEVLRRGNDQILDSLEEGVVILD